MVLRTNELGWVFQSIGAIGSSFVLLIQEKNSGRDELDAVAPFGLLRV